MSGRLLLVIPPVMVRAGGSLELDGDFANNVRAYLGSFDHVTVACPPAPTLANSGLNNPIPASEIEGSERLTLLDLPYPYREDRFLAHYRRVKKLLREEIARADYLLFSPHAPFDWSTLAARLASGMKRQYDMEADWNLENVSRSRWAEMPNGLNKFRKYLWLKFHGRQYRACMRGSTVALLQGQDVFDAYKDLAPNPQKVLNVQVTPDDYAQPFEVERKLGEIEDGAPLTITYSGRVIDIKGPHGWLSAVEQLAASGVRFRATWFGEGELLPQLRRRVEEAGLAEFVSFPGLVDRKVAMDAMRRSHVFMFCHRTAESPRCVVEALACAAPIVGYASRYAEDLVAERGGGAFVDIDDWKGLASLVTALDRDRPRLAELVRQAYHSAELYDRDAAIQKRIELIRKFVQPPAR